MQTLLELIADSFLLFARVADFVLWLYGLPRRLWDGFENPLGGD